MVKTSSSYSESAINKDRAIWAQIALDAFVNQTGQDLITEADDAIGDLLCDLQHLCTKLGFDYDLLLSRGREHFRQESMGREL